MLTIKSMTKKQSFDTLTTFFVRRPGKGNWTGLVSNVSLVSCTLRRPSGKTKEPKRELQVFRINQPSVQRKVDTSSCQFSKRPKF